MALLARRCARTPSAPPQRRSVSRSTAATCGFSLAEKSHALDAAACRGDGITVIDEILTSEQAPSSVAGCEYHGRVRPLDILCGHSFRLEPTAASQTCDLDFICNQGQVRDRQGGMLGELLGVVTTGPTAEDDSAIADHDAEVAHLALEQRSDQSVQWRGGIAFAAHAAGHQRRIVSVQRCFSRCESKMPRLSPYFNGQVIDQPVGEDAARLPKQLNDSSRERGDTLCGGIPYAPEQMVHPIHLL